MFIIGTIKKNISRHKKMSILSILISSMIVLFLLLYIANMEKNESQLLKLSSTIPVTGSICNMDGSLEFGLQIDFEKLQEMCDTGLIKDEVLKTQNYADISTRTYEGKSHRPKLSFVGSNSLEAFSSFSSEDVSYITGYDEKFLTMGEPICILRDIFMKEQNINLGDELEIIAYEPEYNVEGWENFKYKRIGLVKMKVIGSYQYGHSVSEADEAPSIVSPIKFVESIYEGTDMKSYASAARFTLKDPLKINEFKEKMQEIGFTSTNMQAGFSRLGKALTLNDETFIMSATQLTKSLNMLKRLAPMIFIIVAAIGFISSYLLMQSRQREFAIMRSLGTSKNKCFKIIFLESMVLVLLGSIIGAFVSYQIVDIHIKTVGITLLSFIIFYMLGTAVALLLLSRFSVMTILSKTD